jgi:hypothetical protein
LGLLQILGSRHEHLNFAALESYSRGWIRTAWNALNLRDVLEAAVIASHCRRQNRVDLACYVSLMLLRSTLATIHGQELAPNTGVVALKTAKAQFRYYSRQLWGECRDHYLENDEIEKILLNEVAERFRRTIITMRIFPVDLAERMRRRFGDKG